jgi:hypothetical protein
VREKGSGQAMVRASARGAQRVSGPWGHNVFWAVMDNEQ